MKRKIKDRVTGFRTKDGAGVNLVRVLGHNTIETFDPILMLDSFDSTNPDEYTAGFPMHPHRGIETISLVVRGNMVHKDSLGHEDAISDGEVQWMTAGSGILHEEKLPASDKLLGVQLWLNMPKKDKMAAPEYHRIKKNDIKEIPIDGGILRLISGNYKEYEGFKGKYLPLDYYHIILKANNKFTIETEEDKSVLVFLLSSDAKVADEIISEKTAVKLTEGDSLDIESLNEDIQILFISSDKLNEPVSWGGPIVMNTKEEVQQAFDELRSGSFLKEKVEY
jgi:redox-sensitive bicupin YhaK (pirin superfamily)